MAAGRGDRSILSGIALLVGFLGLCLTGGAAHAQDPGAAVPASAVSDQKAGSVLVYGLYTSSGVSPNTQNSRINMTNDDPSTAANVHLFFVGSSGSVADAYICLAPNQTATFLATDIDPGVTGYVVAVAVDALGCPVSHNHLLGDSFVKFSSGHEANLAAHAFTALYSGSLAGCSGSSLSATLNFDGVSYNQAPRVLALDKVRSRADGNDTLLVLNRFGGDMTTTASSIGAATGRLFNSSGTAFPFTFSGGPQFRSSLMNSFPVTVPNYSSVVPAGQGGWMKVYADSDFALLVLDYI